jgi:hypothetical protein
VGKRSFVEVMKIIYGDVAEVTVEGGLTSLAFTDTLRQTQHIFTLEVRPWCGDLQEIEK